MKHTLWITLSLISIFLISQVFGLFTVTKYIGVSVEDGKISIEHPETLLGDQPDLDDKQKNASFIILLATIIGGTLVLLFLIKVNLGVLWKYWFFLAVLLSVSISLGVYINYFIALSISALLAFIKAFKQNTIIHNLSEPLIYTGITIMIIPLINVISAFSLLVLISIYDIYAVRKSKHMVKLANFQTKERAFAGLFIPYSTGPAKIKSRKADTKTAKKVRKSPKTGKAPSIKSEDKKEAILGGGDIAFPMLFSAAVLEKLVGLGIEKYTAFMYVLIISLCSAIALFLLFVKAKKDKFYPAMPFITLGCFVGYLIVYFMMIL